MNTNETSSITLKNGRSINIGTKVYALVGFCLMILGMIAGTSLWQMNRIGVETKGLAGQTAKATDEIISQINEIRNAAKEAVVSMGDISQVISQVDETSSAIVAAIEQPGSATQAIARNVQEAVSGTQEVTRNVTGVSQASQETGAACGQVTSAAENLLGQSTLLKEEVDGFISQIRSA